MNKKKVFSYLFIGLLTVGATGTVTSCKDYDDDINSLQEKIKANADKIAEIEKLVKGGSVITNVAQSETGVTVTLSNGKSFNLTNGETVPKALKASRASLASLVPHGQSAKTAIGIAMARKRITSHVVQRVNKVSKASKANLELQPLLSIMYQTQRHTISTSTKMARK